MADNNKLTPACIVDIVTELPDLQHLDLSRCHRLHPEDMWALESLPKLEYVFSLPDAFRNYYYYYRTTNTSYYN